MNRTRRRGIKRVTNLQSENGVSNPRLHEFCLDLLGLSHLFFPILATYSFQKKFALDLNLLIALCNLK